MYRALTSFATTDYDVKRKQILEDNFTNQAEINEFLRIGYIEVYDGTLEITENGEYNVEDYEKADVDVPSSEPKLQTKTITVTQNGTSTITADANYDGLEKVNLTVNAGTKAILPDGIRFGGTANNINWLDDVDTSNIVTGTSMFQSYTSLRSISAFDTSNMTNINYMFSGCTHLETVPVFNFGKVETYNMNVFQNCSSLTNESLNNILASCITMPITATNNKKLSRIGLSQEQATTCQNLSNYQAFTNAGWITGY